MKNVLAIFAFVMISKCIFAQPETGDSIRTGSDTAAKIYRVTVLSNRNNAKVYLDTSYIGLTPLVNFELREGFHRIKVFSTPSLKNWEAEIETFDLELDRDTTLNSRFRHYYYFNTDPFGAKVIKEDSLLGITPLRFFTYDILTGNLIFRKKNYQDYKFDLVNYDFETGAMLKLKSKGSEVVNDVVYKNRGTQFKTKRHAVPIILLGAASIAGGIFSYTFKNHANEDYDRYLLTGNQEQLDSSNRNDNYFIASLIFMQAAIGGLIYFLFFD